MKILGIDPGITRCGLAVMGEEEQLILSLLIDTKDIEKEEFKIEKIFLAIEEVILKFPISMVICENIFFNKNIGSAIKTGEIIGIVKLLARRNNIPIKCITSQYAKKRILKNGRAKKKDIVEYVKGRFGIEKISRDAADAVIIALTGFPPSLITD